MFSISASSSVSSAPLDVLPAALTRVSSPPPCSSARSSSRWRSAPTDTSAATARHASPSSSATACTFSARRPDTVTRAPRATKCRATPAPIPDPPPVTSTDDPASSRIATPFSRCPARCGPPVRPRRLARRRPTCSTGQRALRRDLAEAECLGQVAAVGGVEQATGLAQFARRVQPRDDVAEDVEDLGIGVPPRPAGRVGALRGTAARSSTAAGRGAPASRPAGRARPRPRRTRRCRPRPSPRLSPGRRPRRRPPPRPRSAQGGSSPARSRRLLSGLQV